MAKPLRVGIIGANARGGWARDGHVPAVRGLAGMQFVAVATNSQQTADEAAKAFGVANAFGSGIELIQESDVDLVVVTTRVQDHRDLVLAALTAGKHVYCEWPLGRGTAEAQEMASAAQAAGLHVAIGLQLRGNPVVRRARALVESGTIGRVLSVRTYSATAGFGPNVPAPYIYLEDPVNFANLVTIQGAHTIDVAIAIAGRLADLSALATVQYPEINADGEKRSRHTFDHLLLQSRFKQGGTLSLEVAGGRPAEEPFSLEVIGEEGVLRLEGGAARGFQSGRLKLSLNGIYQSIDEGEIASIPDAAANVAGLYTALRDDIVHGNSTVADFGHAVQLTKLVTDVLSSSSAGTRLQEINWPEK